MHVTILFYRTLTTQSSASTSAGYLAAHLRQQGISASLTILNIQESAEETASRIRSAIAGCDAILYKPNFKDVHILRANFSAMGRASSVPILFFGPLAFLRHRELFETLPELSGVLLPNHETFVAEIVRWVVHGRGTKQPRGFLSSWDGDPTQAFANEEQLLASFRGIIPARDIELLEPTRIANLEATRGCSRRCTFCHVPASSPWLRGTPIRRLVDEVIEEMSGLASAGKRFLIFNDPIFGGGGSSGRQWVSSFAERLSASGLNVYFMIYTTLDEIERNLEVFEHLASVGLIRVFVGIETASIDAQRKLKKPASFRNYTDIKKKLLSLHIVPHIGFMLFHPFVTNDELSNGVQFLLDSNELHRFGVVYEATRLIPGTELFNQALASGIVSAGEPLKASREYNFFHSQVQTARERLELSVESVGRPLLERIEHLLVSAEFLQNLVSKLGAPEALIRQCYEPIIQVRQYFCFRLFDLLNGVLSGTRVESIDASEFWELRNSLEALCRTFYSAVEGLGLEAPLKWITTGGLASETLRPSAYDGFFTFTRSGEIMRGTRELNQRS